MCYSIEVDKQITQKTIMAKILNQDFYTLDEDIQIKIREFGEALFPDLDDQVNFPISLNDLRDLYEDSLNNANETKIK